MNPRLRTSWAAYVLPLGLSCLPACTAQMSGIYEVEAAWVDARDSLSPWGVDFAFYDIRSTRSFGVVATADNVVLRIEEGLPQVILGWDRYFHAFPPHGTFATLNEDTAVFGGRLTDTFSQEDAVEDEFKESNILVTVLKRTGAQHHVIGPPRPPNGDWGGIEFAESGVGGVYANLGYQATNFPQPRSLRPGLPSVLNQFFIFDGGSWQDIPQPVAEPYLAFGSICTDRNGVLWASGSIIAVDDDRNYVRERGYVTRYSNGVWTETSPPAPREKHVSWTLPFLACGPTGPWVGGGAIDDPDRVVSWRGDDIPLVYRLVNDEWQQIELPHPIDPDGRRPDRLGLGAFAIDDRDRLWVTFWRDPDVATNPILMFDGQGWTAYRLPEIPGVSRYHVHGIAFDVSGEGWAVSNQYGDVVRPENRGILLRFTDGQWRLQNWTWPFWRQRWLGLFG